MPPKKNKKNDIVLDCPSELECPVAERLDFRLKFEELIIQLSADFISHNWSYIDEEIDRALEVIGRFISADRCYVFMLDHANQVINNTYEWTDEGISREKDNLQGIPFSALPWWMSKLAKNEIIDIPDLSELGEEGAAERPALEAQHIKSLVVVPMQYQGETIGFIGFDSVSKYTRWSADSLKMLRVAGGMISNAIKRKENEQALSDSEARYKSVVNNIKEVIFQTDAQGLWTFLNPAWTEITGYTVAESLGTNFLNYVHEEDREKNMKLFAPLIERKKEYCRHEIRYYTKAGGFRWIEVYARLLLNDNDEAVGTTGTLNDITVRKYSQEEIRKLSRAVETAPSAILLCSLEGIITYVNPGLLKMGGYKAEQILGNSIFDYSNQTGTNRLKGEIFPILMNGEKWTGEVELKNSRGEFFPAEMTCSLVTDDNGFPEHLLATFYDITKRKKDEEEVRNALMREKELSDLKSRFVSMVSHEFRTPLAAILSSSELLELYWEKWDPEKRDSLLKKINRSVKDLTDMLNDITAINYADSGRIQLNIETIGIFQYIEEIIEEVKSSYPERPAVHFEKGKNELMFATDKKLLRQVIMNLLSNAVKYTPADKNVYIYLWKNGSKVIFKVKDEGIGIPEEDFPNLFEPFVRSKNTGKIKGTGLGLSILKRALEMLNGEIRFTSSLNAGSEFIVSIPLIKSVK